MKPSDVLAHKYKAAIELITRDYLRHFTLPNVNEDEPSKHKESSPVSSRVFRLVTAYLDNHSWSADLRLMVGSRIMALMLVEDGRNADQQIAFCCGIPVREHEGDPYHFWLENARGAINVGALKQ